MICKCAAHPLRPPSVGSDHASAFAQPHLTPASPVIVIVIVIITAGTYNSMKWRAKFL